MRTAVILLALTLFAGLGCSGNGSGNPLSLTPDNSAGIVDNGKTTHTNWGLWQFICDPSTQKIDIVRLRTGAMHLNALVFVDKPPLTYLTLESLKFNGNLIDADIGLRHPFLGLNEFSGFDVKGILISDGSINGFADPDINLPGTGDTRLLNPDGYSRWWNPAEFPHTDTMFGYKDGLLGTPDDVAHYSGILNGYKYFCDDLDDPDAPLSDIDPTGRGVFSAGMKNVRHYTIELGNEGLIFNYAVDASWQFPTGPAPWSVPDDFAPQANQPEAYRITVTELEKTLYYDVEKSTGGGDLKLAIDVYDWFSADLNTVSVEWPDFAAQASSPGPVGGGIGFSTYEVEMPACTPGGVGDQKLLITAASENKGYGGIIPDIPVSAYFIYKVYVPAGGGEVEPPDVCTNWGVETGRYNLWNGQDIYDIFTQFNLASDSNGKVWMWCHRTSNALSRSGTPFNGNWGNMWEENLLPHINVWVFWGSVVDVSVTKAFDGGLMAGCSPSDNTGANNPLSIAWWDGAKWHDSDSEIYILYYVKTSDQVANRIAAYRDSTGRFHAYIQNNGNLVDWYSDTWQGAWSQNTIAPMPVGQPDYACQTRTDYAFESSDNYIYMCWVDGGIKVARAKAGTNTWDIIWEITDPNYDSPTMYIDNAGRLFLAARYYISDTEDQIRLFKSTNGIDFGEPLTIFSEAGTRVDPCYLTLKGDVKDQLFLTFPYRPGAVGAFAAIIAGNPGGTKWTDVCVLTDVNIKHPALAIRPDGSLEVCYGHVILGGYDQGSTDSPFSERNELWGRSNPGFIG